MWHQPRYLCYAYPMSDTETPPPATGEPAPKNKGGRPRRPDGIDPTRSAGRHGKIWDDCAQQAKSDGQTMTAFVGEAITRELARRQRAARTDQANAALGPRDPWDRTPPRRDGDLRRLDTGQLQEWGGDQWHDVAEPPTALAPVTVIETDARTGATAEVEVPAELAARIFGRAPAAPAVSATPPPGWPPNPDPTPEGEIAVGVAASGPVPPGIWEPVIEPTAGHLIPAGLARLSDPPEPIRSPVDVACESVVGPIVRGDTFPHVTPAAVADRFIHGDRSVPAGPRGLLHVTGDMQLTGPGWGRGLTTAEIEQATGPTSPGYDTDGEGNAIEDDEPEHWQCDTCGKEFDTRAAFEGHESENTHPEEPDDDPPAFPDAVVSAFEALPFAPGLACSLHGGVAHDVPDGTGWIDCGPDVCGHPPREAHTLNHPGSDRWTGGDRKDER